MPEKDIDEALERIGKANREQKPVDPARPAQKGDAIKLDFVGSVDGVEFPRGAAQDYVLELGSARSSRASRTSWSAPRSASRST